MEENQQQLVAYGHIFNQLLQSERFKQFMSVHFTIQKFVDEESKTIDIQVIENPPETVMQKMSAEIKNQEPSGKIQIVNPSTAEKIVKQAERAAKASAKLR
jgi:hypothetical protein